MIKSLCQLYPCRNKLISLGIKYQYLGIALINLELIYFFKGISFIPSECWEIQLIYSGIRFKSQGIDILDLVKSKLRCISLWEHEKSIYINQIHGYILEIILVQSDSHSQPGSKITPILFLN